MTTQPIDVAPDDDEELEPEVLRVRTRFNPLAVYRVGQVVHKEARPWTATVHALLRHLEAVGFAGAPRLVGPGYDQQGYETLTYIAGEVNAPGPWSLEGAAQVGALLRDLHEAAASFRPPADARWRPWYGRPLGTGPGIIGHCDAAPWNIVAQDGLPVALIDWDYAGPVDPLVDLAQACWLNAKLHDDMVSEREGLPPLTERARQLRAIVEGYRLPARQRAGLVELMIAFAVYSVAAEADDAEITPDTASDAVDRQVLWAMAWRARSAAWMLRHQRVLEAALRERAPHKIVSA